MVSDRILKACMFPDILANEKQLRCLCFYPTDACNLACPWCNSASRRAGRVFPLKDAYEFFLIASDLGLKAVNFSGGGEPFMHPDIESLLLTARLLELETNTITNGTLLDTVSKELLSTMVWIRVSINAGPKLYEKIHGAPLFDRVIKNVHSMSGFNNRRGVNYVWTHGSTVEDFASLVECLEGANLDYVRVSSDQFSRAGQSACELPDLFDLMDVMPKNLPLEVHRYRYPAVPGKCKTQWIKPVLDSDGMIYPCTLSKKPLCHWRDIEHFWKLKVDTVDTRTCKWCLFGDVNAFLNDLDCVRDRKDLNSL